MTFVRGAACEEVNEISLFFQHLEWCDERMQKGKIM